VDDLRTLAEKAMDELAEIVLVPARQPEDFTADEFAARLGTSRQSAVYQLNKMVDRGAVGTEKRRDPNTNQRVRVYWVIAASSPPETPGDAPRQCPPEPV